MSIIEVGKINSYLDTRYDKSKIDKILDKAFDLKGLDNDEIAALLNLEDETSIQKLFEAAKTIKERIFGREIEFFAPLYISNHCLNNCLYCGFREGNKELKRKVLTVDQAVSQAQKIIETGHRILLVAGEDLKMAPVEHIKQIVEDIYADNSNIKLDLNLAPLNVEQFKEVSSWNIGTYQTIQESYHPAAYNRMHTSGPKADYNMRLKVWDRAIEGGIKDFGLGVLFGLYDCRFETLALVEHSRYLLNKYGMGPHTISVQRIEPAQGSDVSKTPPYQVIDQQFPKIIAALRLALPYTELILTTRETPDIRKTALESGLTGAIADAQTTQSDYLEEHVLAQVL